MQPGKASNETETGIALIEPDNRLIIDSPFIFQLISGFRSRLSELQSQSVTLLALQDCLIAGPEEYLLLRVFSF